MTEPAATPLEPSARDYRTRLYEAYATTHAGLADPTGAALAFRRDIAPHLPAPDAQRVIDLGCGQGQLVRLLKQHGFEKAEGIDLSEEQVRLAHQSGIASVRQGDFRNGLGDSEYAVVTATDLLEHLTTSEVVEALDLTREALTVGGRLIVRVPNAVSPLVGNYQHGDITHISHFSARSMRQVAAATGFTSVSVHPCPPIVHGARSALRSAVWKVCSAGIKTALAAETGQLRGHLVTQNIVAVLHRSA